MVARLAPLQRAAIAALLSALLALAAWSTPALAADLPAPGVPLPIQASVEDGVAWQLDDYHVEALAAYDVTARVLSARHYDPSTGREAEVSPLDLALGWGPMADREFLASLDVSQRDRWYYVNWRDFAVDARQVIEHSANTHILPANPEVAAQLANVSAGDVVRLQGYLVEVTAEDGWTWRSSLTRHDTGDGSCEVLWVEAVEVTPAEPITYASNR